MSSNGKVCLLHLGMQQPSALHLSKQLLRAGYDVQNCELGELMGINVSGIPVVVNVQASDDNEHGLEEALSQLSDQNARIIINETAASNNLVGWNKNRWVRHILHKIDQANGILPDPKIEKSGNENIDLNAMGIEQVWLLAASIGGPESLIKFLASFDGDEPVLFIIVQHMDDEFVEMMVNQLNKNNTIPVTLPQLGERIRPSQALLIPVSESLVIEADGHVSSKDVNPNRLTTPCIDDICLDMIDQLKQLNMAVFSGMATDGVKGAANIYGNGGVVITQSADSCVVSAIAEEVRQKKYSQFDGEPEAMAQYIKQQL